MRDGPQKSWLQPRNAGKLHVTIYQLCLHDQQASIWKETRLDIFYGCRWEANLSPGCTNKSHSWRIMGASSWHTMPASTQHPVATRSWTAGEMCVRSQFLRTSPGGPAWSSPVHRACAPAFKSLTVRHPCHKVGELAFFRTWGSCWVPLECVEWLVN